MNKLEQRIYDLRRQLQCLSREVCTLSEGGNTETDPVFTASPAFNITSSDISNWTTNSHTHSHKAVLDGITDGLVTNWNSAYTTTQSLSTTYFPLSGGTITGTGGNGFVGLSLQSSAPTAPTTGVKIFSDSTSRFSWKTPLDSFTRTITTAASITADRAWTLPDSSGEIITSGSSQSIAGTKTFSDIVTFAASPVPNGNLTRTFGSSAANWQTVYSSRFWSSSFATFGTTSTAASISIQFGSTTFAGGWFANTGDVFFQSAGAIPTTNGAGAQFLHTKTAASGVARGVYITNTLTAAANNDVLVSLDISPTFTNGAFTGVTNYAIRTVNSGILLGGNLTFSANNTYNIGDSTNKVAVAYINSVLTNAILTLGGVGTTVPILFRQGTGSQLIGGFAATTGNFILQSSAAALTADTGERLQVQGTSLLNGLVTYGAGFKNKTTSSAAATLTLDTANTIYSFTGTTSTWTLPTLTGNAGLTYFLINRGSGTITLNSNVGGNDIYNNAALTNTLAIIAGATIQIRHDGTYWVVIT